MPHTDHPKAATKSHAERWLKRLPLRWTRNVVVAGLALSVASLLPIVLSSQAFASSDVGYYLVLTVALALFAFLFGALARYGLKGALGRSPDEALRTLTAKFVTGAASLAGVLLLSDILFQWRNEYRFGQPGNAAEDIGYFGGFVGSAALMALLVSLVSKWGLRKAIARDGVAPKREQREPTNSAAVVGLPSSPVSDVAISASSEQPPVAPRPEARPSSNLFVKHWRGEISLGWSYWGVAFVGNVLALLAILGVNQLFTTDKGFDPGPIFWMQVTVWAIVLVVTVWQVVGTWRSATNHAARRIAANLGTGWATAAKVMLAIGVIRTIAEFSQGGALQIAETYDMAFRGDPRMPPYSLRVMRNGTEIEVTGGFKFGLTADFERVVSASPRIRVVHLTSVGGRIGEAAKLNDAIRKRGLVTYVSTHCESACTLAFASGRERWLNKGGKLGFHGPAFAGMTFADLAVAARSWKAQYIAAGFATGFVDRALAVPSAEMWYPTEQEMLAAGVITNLSDGSQFAASGYERDLTKDMLADGMAKYIPSFAAMKTRLPQDYQRIAQAYFDGYMNGQTEVQLIAAFREELLSVIKDHKARADDSVLIDFARVAVDQYIALGQRNPTLCYRYAAGLGAVNLSGEVPPALVQRELALGERVIATSAPRAPVNPQVVKALLVRVYTNLAKRFTTENLGIFQLSSVPPSRHAEYCAITAALYQEILAMRPVEAAVILRSFETP